jgi:hypothetical protein
MYSIPYRNTLMDCGIDPLVLLHGQHPHQAEFQISPLEFRVPKMDEEKPEPPHRPFSHANLIQPSQQRRR